MAFIKLQKTKAYFKRFQTKFRRRREGKTDYYQRKRLVAQAKNKYATPKYRLVVRITNKTVICQIVSSKIVGDAVLAAAYSSELPRYGIKCGLTNWAAAYATGLLVARRTLNKLKLDTAYAGNDDVTGEYYAVEANEEGPRPFRAFLDIGLRRATTGHRVFGCLKGAVDGGLNIPYSEKRFPGWDGKELDAELLRSYIFGGHVQEYMEYLQEDDEDTFRKQFSTFIAAGVEPDALEEIYENAHEAIRADPAAKPSARKQLTAEQKQKLRAYKCTRLSHAQRKARIQAKIAKFNKRTGLEGGL